VQLHRYYSRRPGVECEVDEQTNTVGRRPDLLIAVLGLRRLAVEVTAIGESQANQSSARQRRRLIDELINRVELRGYLVDVVHLPPAEVNLPIRKLAADLQRTIDALPPAKTRQPSVVTEVTLGREPAEVRVRIIKGIGLGRLTHDVLVTAAASWNWPGHRIRRRLDEKRPSSKDVDRAIPYVVVLATRLLDLAVDDVVQAVYGVPQGDDNVEPGFLSANSRVSAVLWVPIRDLRSRGFTSGVLLENFSAVAPVDRELVPWSLRAIDSGVLPLADHVTFEDCRATSFSLPVVRDALRSDAISELRAFAQG
jgi:hypothetical protein